MSDQKQTLEYGRQEKQRLPPFIRELVLAVVILLITALLVLLIVPTIPMR
jgi:hypothetical protein